jgi:WD40 repeat protein
MIQNQAANKVESPSPSYDQEYNEEEIRHSGTILTKNDVFEGNFYNYFLIYVPFGILHDYDIGHTARIFSLAVCSLPNGNKISASASHDRTVKIWCVNSNTCLRTIGYPDFVWRVFLVTSLSGKVCIIAFISTENQVYVTDLDTGENLHIVTGRLIYAGVLPLYNFPVIITLVNDEDLAIFDACCGNCVRHIHGGFPRVFRAVVSYDKIDPALIYSTWDSQTRRSSIQAYYLSTLNQPTYDEFAYLENDNSPNESGIIVNNLYQRNTSDDSLLSTNSNQHDPITFPGLKINEKFSPHKSVSMFVGDSRDGITSVSISQSYTTVKPVVCSGHYDHVVRVWDVKTLTLLSVLRGIDYALDLIMIIIM